MKGNHMTWKEFKTLVEKELDGSDPEIDYIDTDIDPEHLEVFFNKDDNTIRIH